MDVVVISELKQRVFQYKSFWKIRYWLKIKTFYLSKLLYSQFQKFIEFRTTLAVIANMFKSSIKYFLLPIFIASLLQYFELPLRSWFVTNGWIILKDSDYATLVATVTSISGLFIGLYYAAVTSIGGAIYSKVPQSLRQLLLSERFGNAYLKYLVFFTSLGILLLSQYVLGYRVNPLNIPLIAMLAGFAVFAFFQLGVRVLKLFEPTQFAGEIFSNMADSVRRVQPSNARWDDSVFQNHERKSVEYWLETIEALADISSSEKHLSGRVFVEFVTALSRFLCWYEFQKDQIPRNSGWFKTSYKHLDWYKTSDTQTSIAHHTGSILEPIKEPKYRWLEVELSKILFSCIKVNLANKNYTTANTTITYLEQYIKIISSKGDLNWASEVVHQASKICEAHINSVCRARAKETVELIGLCDAISTLPIQIYLSFVRHLSNRSGDKISQLIKRNNWQNKSLIYGEKISERSIKKLEWLAERISFELDVEGKVITPNWYIENEVCKEEASSFVENISIVLDTIGKQYQSWTAKLIDSKRYWLASACSVREKEFWHKTLYQLTVIDDYWKSLTAFQKHDEKWPSLQIDDLRNRLTEKHSEVERYRVKLLVNLLSQERPENFPDFPGTFLHSQGEAIFDALMLNDTSRFKEMFPTYFLASFYKFSELLPRDFDELWKTENIAKIASAALIDLLDLSGYGIVLGRFYNNDGITRLITSTWQQYLDRVPSRVSQILGAVNMVDSAFEIPHRNEHRFYWKRTIKEKLTKEIEVKLVACKSYQFAPEYIRLHKEPLVRVFAGEDRGLGHTGVDVFVSEVLIPKIGDPKNEIKNFRRDLREEVSSEVSRYNEYMEQKDEQ